MRKADLDRLRRRLEARLVELYRSSHQAVRTQLLADRDTDEPKDEGDSAQLSQTDGLVAGLAEGQTALAQRIEEALVRMTHGEFGSCIDCDTEIDEDRLALVPWAVRCAECQETFEGERRAPTL
jgi:DnaK suppressor protein